MEQTEKFEQIFNTIVKNNKRYLANYDGTMTWIGTTIPYVQHMHLLTDAEKDQVAEIMKRLATGQL